MGTLCPAPVFGLMGTAHPCTGCPAFNKAQLCSTMKPGGCKLEQQKKKESTP